MLTGRTGVFTRADLLASLSGPAITAAPPLEVVEFDCHAFLEPSFEEFIWAIRGTKQDFTDGPHFWITALQAQGWKGREAYFLPYAESGLCEPLTRTEFARLVAEYSGSLRERLPPFLLDLSGVWSGLKMYADWNDVGAVGELREEYVAFFWSTTA